MIQVCFGEKCPSKPECKLAEKPADKRAEIRWIAMWVRRKPDEKACDQFVPIAP